MLLFVFHCACYVCSSSLAEAKGKIVNLIFSGQMELLGHDVSLLGQLDNVREIWVKCIGVQQHSLEQMCVLPTLYKWRRGVKKEIKSDNGRIMILETNIDDEISVLVNVYAPNNIHAQQIFFKNFQRCFRTTQIPSLL